MEIYIQKNVRRSNKKMFGRKKKSKAVAPPVEEEEIPELAEEEPEPILEPVEQSAPVPAEKPAEDELTEERAKQILINHEARLKRIEYHLRL